MKTERFEDSQQVRQNMWAEEHVMFLDPVSLTRVKSIAEKLENIFRPHLEYDSAQSLHIELEVIHM